MGREVGVVIRWVGRKVGVVMRKEGNRLILKKVERGMLVSRMVLWWGGRSNVWINNL